MSRYHKGRAGHAYVDGRIGGNRAAGCDGQSGDGGTRGNDGQSAASD